LRTEGGERKSSLPVETPGARLLARGRATAFREQLVPDREAQSRSPIRHGDVVEAPRSGRSVLNAPVSALDVLSGRAEHRAARRRQRGVSVENIRK
jgi:hypothetical protein